MPPLQPTPLVSEHSAPACSDAQILRLMQRGDRHAFALFYDRHAPAVLGLACRIVKDRALAEDVAQEAFISIWRGCGRYCPDRGNARSWALGITHHRAVDALRNQSARARAKTKVEALTPRAAASDPTELAAARDEEARATREAVAALPTQQRLVIELGYFGGLSHREIAARQGVPLGTVKGRMRLALEKLAGALDPGPSAV